MAKTITWKKKKGKAKEIRPKDVQPQGAKNGEG
jgi:hypothetical protein